MKTKVAYMFTLLVFILASCGGKQGQVEQSPEQTEPADPYLAWETNKGIGPVKALDLPASVDQQLAEKGMEVYTSKCSACHKPDKKFIGPPPKDILTRRTAEWVMNMILNPEVMIAEDPIAKKLMIEYNGAPMANQNLTEEEARAVLEYFRTL